MNKIKQLIDDGVITEANVINYYHNEIKARIQPISEYSFEDDYIPGEELYTPEQDDQNFDQLSQESPIYEDSQYDPFPEYILASTSTLYNLNETMLFGANEDGKVLNWSELGMLAERHGDQNWADKNAAVALLVHPEYKYVFEKDVQGMYLHVSQSLYRRTTLEDLKNESDLNSFESQTF